MYICTIYALSFQPLIKCLQAASTVKQCCFADDTSGAGSATEIKMWWDTLNTLGPDFGFFLFFSFLFCKSIEIF